MLYFFLMCFITNDEFSIIHAVASIRLELADNIGKFIDSQKTWLMAHHDSPTSSTISRLIEIPKVQLRDKNCVFSPDVYSETLDKAIHLLKNHTICCDFVPTFRVLIHLFT